MKPIKFTTLEQFDTVLRTKARVAEGNREENLQWALSCLEPLLAKVPIDPEVVSMIETAKRHETTRISVPVGRQMAIRIHRIAKAEEDLVKQFTYRAIAHSIATIHVRTHAYGMVIYSLKAYHQLGYSLEQLLAIAQEYEKRLG